LDAEDVPDAFVAVTVNVYAVPFVNPVTVIGLLEPVAVTPPGEDVTVYDDAPADAVNDTTADALPGAALTFVGADGTASGVTAVDALDAEDVPVPFVAVIVNVYAVPLVKPLTVIGLDVPVAVIPPGDDVTVYDTA
jgi:hypothetical protein